MFHVDIARALKLLYYCLYIMRENVRWFCKTYYYYNVNSYLQRRIMSTAESHFYKHKYIHIYHNTQPRFRLTYNIML